MSEPDWKTDLDRDLVMNGYRIGYDVDTDAVMDIVLPHIEAAYQRGLMAGRSQQGYATTRRKKKEESWSALTASDTGASASASGTARDASSPPASAPRGEP